MKHKRLLMTLILGMSMLILSWCLGVARPVSSRQAPALGTPPLPPQAASQPAGNADALVVQHRSALQTVTISPSQDNTLYGPGTDSSGVGGYLKTGVKCGDGWWYRGVIAFDVASHIPAGSTIINTTLRLYTTRISCKYNEPRLTSLHRLLASWGEGTSNDNNDDCLGDSATTGDATWQHRFYPNTFWSTPGGDFRSTASATTNVTALGFDDWGSTSRMVADVQTWLDSPAANHGWLIRGVEDECPLSINTRTVFASREHTPAAYRPLLTVQYRPLMPELAVDKTVSDPTPHVGQRITYTLVIANFGLADATNIRVTDTLPPEVHFVGPVTRDPPGPGTLGPPPILATGLSIAPGNSITLIFPVTVAKGLPLDTQFVNAVSVTSAQVPTPTTDTAAASVSSAITVDKMVDNATPTGHETFTYTIVIANIGSVDAAGILVSDTLPAGLDFVGPVTLDPPGPGTLGPPPALGRDLLIPAGSAITLTFPVKIGSGVPLGTQFINTAAVNSVDMPTFVTDTVFAGLLPPPMTTHLSPIRDNTLYQHPLGNLSNGAGQHFFAGQNDLTEKRRGVIAFDVAGSIPAGSTVTTATLRLYMSKSSSGPYSISLHRLQAGWGEGTSTALGAEGSGADATLGDATWMHAFYDITPWSTPGGDFCTAPSAVAQVDSVGFYEWGSTVETVADVQSWLDNPAANSGWLLLGDETQKHTAKRFDSRENATLANRPVLIVQYVPITMHTVLEVSKSVNEPAPLAGQRITYTIVVTNPYPADATDVLISDTLPAGLTLAGVVALDPPGQGTLGTPPTLASNLLITAERTITLTFPVTVGANLAPSTRIVNTVTVIDAPDTILDTDTAIITVESIKEIIDTYYIYLPFIFP